MSVDTKSTDVLLDWWFSVVLSGVSDSSLQSDFNVVKFVLTT